MDFSKMTLFASMKKRMDWLIQRQEVLAQNIANADTPKYRAKDLKKFDFAQLVRQENRQLPMKMTHASHLPGARRRIRDFAEQTTRRPYETAPAGNAVVLEEQMGKIAESSIQYKLMTELYKKHMGMFRMALSKE